MSAASPTTAKGTSWTPPPAEVCFQSSQWGVSEPETGVQWNVRLCTCGLQTWNHSCMAFTACCRCLSMVFTERPRKQIARSSTKSALKMSLAIHEGSSLIRECCPNSDSDAPVPEIFCNKNRQSASEANPVKVSDDATLPGFLIGFLQVKEETNCLLPLSKGISEISFKAHQVVARAISSVDVTGGCQHSRCYCRQTLLEIDTYSCCVFVFKWKNIIQQWKYI